MNCADCSRDVGTKVAGARQTTQARISCRFQAVRWVLPTLLLVLVPKCPMCLAAYVLLFSGIALSVATAMVLRVLLICLCLCVLLYVAFGWMIGRAKLLSQREQ